MSLAILICTYNKYRSLDRCLRSIKDQSISPDHIVIIENSPTDTQRINGLLRSLFNRSIKLTYVPVASCTISESRNIAIAHANEDIILFVDDDVCLRSDYIEQLKNTYRAHSDYSVIVGRIIPEKSGYWEIFTNKILTSHVTDENKKQQIEFWPALNLSFRRSIRVRFNQQLSAMEDLEFCMRLVQKKIAINYIPQLYCTHEYISTIFQFIHKFSYYYEKNLSRIRKDNTLTYVSGFPKLNKHSLLSYLRVARFYFNHSRTLLVHIKLPIRYYFACLIYHFLLFRAVYFESSMSAQIYKPSHAQSWHFFDKD